MTESKMCRREADQNKGGKTPTSGKEPFPNGYFILVKSLDRCSGDDAQGQASRDEAPAPAPGMKNRTTSQRFPADVPRGASPLPLLCTGMAPSQPDLAQKQQPKFPPIKRASQFISEREKTLAATSVPGRPGWSPDARREEDRLGQLIRSGRERLSLAATASREGLEPRRSLLVSEEPLSSLLWLLPEPPF
uniref:uncharacterized protein LOC114582562 isoform X2 n=1 Tax=Podarcis muralis TaxID=64176 RepID=UPI0010A05080|nr:uncharacterized protein LOC114582562 isoform X2 [Podarcis muralis]